jgi:hypothetical protein
MSKKDTKLVPNGIYRKVIGRTTHYATCIAVAVDNQGIKGVLAQCGLADEVVREGSENFNTWTRVRKIKHDPVDIAELIKGIGEAIVGVAETTVEVATGIDKAVEVIGELRKPAKK